MCLCLQAKNLLILYDAVSTLADSVGHELNKPEHIQVLLPPLFERWRLLPDDHKDLMPLLECMTSVVQALGLGFQPFAAEERARFGVSDLPRRRFVCTVHMCMRISPALRVSFREARQTELGTLHAFRLMVSLLRVLACHYLARAVYSRCLRIIERTCMAHATGHPDPPDKDFIVCSLDLLSGMAEGLGQSIESLVGPSNLFQLLFHCMKVQQYPSTVPAAPTVPAVPAVLAVQLLFR